MNCKGVKVKSVCYGSQPGREIIHVCKRQIAPPGKTGGGYLTLTNIGKS